jgi:hypothetical protein
MLIITNIDPRYMVKNCFLGRELGLTSFVYFEGGNLTFFNKACLSKTYTSVASARREVFRRIREFA